MNAILVLMMLLAQAFATGPAPNSGDGTPDGSGMSVAPHGTGVTPGPAPNSGDGVSDGSGF